jgi:hypothetical protein
MQYRVAETDDEYMLCKALLVEQGFDYQELGFPTIMAMDGDLLAGFVATTPHDDMVLAGPLVMDVDHKAAPLVAAQLVRLYETAMMNIGITSFVFYTDERDSPMGRAMAGMFKHVQPYAKVGTRLFYHWKTKEGRVA